MSGDDKFPIPFISEYEHVKLDPKNKTLTAEQKEKLTKNIKLFRDAIVFFTTSGAARGVSGHTGGPFDMTPETVLLLAVFEGEAKENFVHTLFDAAGHRVALQYLLCAFFGAIPPEKLLEYRLAFSKLPGHPELGLTDGVQFSSGRLGHLWGMVNGIALQDRKKSVICFESDGSFQEGDDAESARLAVSQKLNIKLFFDINDVTIAGHPSQYLPGFTVKQTLQGHGVTSFDAQGEDIDSLWGAVAQVLTTDGPAAVLSTRKMCPGIEGLEGETHGHDVIPVDKALKYLEDRGYGKRCSEIIKAIKPNSLPYEYVGSTKDKEATRVQFGKAVNLVLGKLSKEEIARRVVVIDSDLEGSTGIAAIHKEHPECFISSGIMERGNFSAAAGFGFGNLGDNDRVGVFSTFSAFLEMIVSELTMARLNFCNVLCHFSHSGVDEVADNTCHFGINSFFADNGLEDGYKTQMFFPADAAQMTAIVKKVFFDKSIRFIFSTRAKVPYVLKQGSDSEQLYGEGYEFTPGKDEFVRKGTKGNVIAFGELVFRALDAVDRLRAEGHDIGLVNKSTVNAIDEEALKIYGSQGFVLVAESWNYKTGLGSRLGTWLIERGYTPKYKHIGTSREGCGGIGEQIYHQGLDPESIYKEIKQLL